MKCAVLALTLFLLSACSQDAGEVDEKTLAATAAQLDQQANDDVTRAIKKIDAEVPNNQPSSSNKAHE
jgi:hypothetical protein